MKQLILIRHAKSSWEYQVGDQDRPLAQRGIDDAHLVGTALAAKEWAIDHVYASPANRALHTGMIVSRKLGYPLDKVCITPDLYDFSGESVRSFLMGLDNTLETVAFFGHNHAFTFLANELGSQVIDNVPTSGLVQIRFQVASWGKVEKGTTMATLFPKHLK